MKKSPASKRLKALKITNSALGRRLGVTQSSVSQALANAIFMILS
jgi:DNA-binding MarR family transcriptional regulator